MGGHGRSARSESVSRSARPPTHLSVFDGAFGVLTGLLVLLAHLGNRRPDHHSTTPASEAGRDENARVPECNAQRKERSVHDAGRLVLSHAEHDVTETATELRADKGVIEQPTHEPALTCGRRDTLVAMLVTLAAMLRNPQQVSERNTRLKQAAATPLTD